MKNFKLFVAAALAGTFLNFMLPLGGFAFCLFLGPGMSEEETTRQNWWMWIFGSLTGTVVALCLIAYAFRASTN